MGQAKLRGTKEERAVEARLRKYNILRYHVDRLSRQASPKHKKLVEEFNSRLTVLSQNPEALLNVWYDETAVIPMDAYNLLPTGADDD